MSDKRIYEYETIVLDKNNLMFSIQLYSPLDVPPKVHLYLPPFFSLFTSDFLSSLIFLTPVNTEEINFYELFFTNIII